MFLLSTPSSVQEVSLSGRCCEAFPGDVAVGIRKPGRSSPLLEDPPIKTSSRIPSLSDTHASYLGVAGRRCVLVDEGAHKESF